MCKCIKLLVSKGCVDRDVYTDLDDKIQENGYFIHGTVNKKVLAGCEKINYCPICGGGLSMKELNNV